jgi:hypothetical protein
MRRRRRLRALDTIVGVGVAAVALGATIHALTRSPAEHSTEGPATLELSAPERVEIRRALQSADARGTLVFASPGCRLAGFDLPALTSFRDLDVRACFAAVSPRSPAPSGWFVWRRPLYLFARCVGGGIEVSASGGQSVRFVRGCAPAWRPDGTLTYVRRGEATRFPHAGRATVVLGRYELDAAFGADRRPRVRELGWVTDDRVAALVELDRGATVVLAFFVRGELTTARPVPRGSWRLAVRPRRDEAVVIDRSSGEAFKLAGRADVVPLGAGALSASWSPDGRLLALVRRGRIELVDPGDASRIRLSVAGRMVAWR